MYIALIVLAAVSDLAYLLPQVLKAFFFPELRGFWISLGQLIDAVSVTGCKGGSVFPVCPVPDPNRSGSTQRITASTARIRIRMIHFFLNCICLSVYLTIYASAPDE